MTWLTDLKIEPFTTPELRSPAQIEKVLPASQKSKLADYTMKESSGTTLALAVDPRPAADMTATKGQAALMQQQARAILNRAKSKPKPEPGETTP